MKKRKTALIFAGAFILASSVAMSACDVEETQYEVPNYQGQLQEGETKSDYNKALFYRNDKKVYGADPFVLDNTSRDGYYYMYTTYGACMCFRSKNMTDWEPVGNALDNMHYDANGNPAEVRRVTNDAIWAEEVIYDEQTELYYLFFSATPAADGNVTTGQGVASGTPIYLLYVATSKVPYRDFKLVNFFDGESCGEGNLHNFNRQTGILADGSESEYKRAYPHYFSKYLLFDPEQYLSFLEKEGVDLSLRQVANYWGAIDPHPYEKDGKKYLYWVCDVGDNGICGVEMENWLKPKWETAKLLTMNEYYTVADWNSAKAGGTVEKVSYENAGNIINEGPTMTFHNGKYYLTFSVNDYGNASYQVAQAIADEPLGTFRKLTAEEGGVLISGGTQGSLEVTGTGHHSFVTVGGTEYIVYHRHDDTTVMGASRNPAVDEIKWITIKDKNNNDLDVMYANGPTSTVQPAIKSEYKNIAGEAAVTGSDDAQYLTDGLLSLYTNANETFISNVKETSLSAETTFNFEFSSARAVCAVMVYNSKDASKIFKAVKRIEFVCEEDGKEVIRFIKDLQFSKENYRADDLYDIAYYVTPGSAVYAEFDELKVKAIRITVEVPEGQKTVGISEVRILGK